MKIIQFFKYLFLFLAVDDTVKLVSAVLEKDWGKVVQHTGGLCLSLGLFVIYHKGLVLDKLAFYLLMGCIVLISVRTAQYFLLHTYSKAIPCLLAIAVCVFNIIITTKDEKLNWERET